MWHPFKGRADFAAASPKGFEQIGLWVSHPITCCQSHVWVVLKKQQQQSRTFLVEEEICLLTIPASIFSIGNKGNDGA